jgi:hypothetical protein
MRVSTHGTLGIAAIVAVGVGCGSSTPLTTRMDGAAGASGTGGAAIPPGSGGATVPGAGGSIAGIGGSAPVGTGGSLAGTGGLATGGFVGQGGAPGAGGIAGSARGGSGSGGNSGGGPGTGSGGQGSGGRQGSGGTGTGARPGSGGAGTGGATGTGGSTSAGGGAGAAGSPGSGGLGTGDSPGAGGSGAAGGSTGAGGTLGAGGGTGTCSVTCDSLFPTCCGNVCVYTANDPENCGGCGVRCPTGEYCNEQGCGPVPCTIAGGGCISVAGCCGDACCGLDQTCCAMNSPLGPMRPVCFTPTAEIPRCPGNVPVVSDRNLKKNVSAADVDQVLARLRALPMSTWTYLDEPSSVRHLGPMAQDFRASFGLGSDSRSYSPVDGHGVALAAIQALDRLVRAQQERIEGLQRANRDLARRLKSVESRPRR